MLASETGAILRLFTLYNFIMLFFYISDKLRDNIQLIKLPFINIILFIVTRILPHIIQYVNYRSVGRHNFQRFGLSTMFNKNIFPNRRYLAFYLYIPLTLVNNFLSVLFSHCKLISLANLESRIWMILMVLRWVH